uniref:Roadblock/LAMTOR2 domain-containing protein n=1 Tax=Thermofilum pendens TaxID=2269 RepID=A0A7C3SPX0_THEPE
MAEILERLRRLPGVEKVVLFSSTGVPVASEDSLVVAAVSAVVVDSSAHLMQELSADYSYTVVASSNGVAALLLKLSEDLYATLLVKKEHLPRVLEKLNMC